MSKLIKFETAELPALRVIGKAIRPVMSMTENPIPAFWTQCFSDGTFTALQAMGESVFDPSYVGFMCDWSAGDNKFTYICGMLMKAGAQAPEGFAAHDVAACQAAVGWIQGPEKENYAAAHEMTAGEMARQGWKPDEAAGWCMELYNCPRFTVPQANGDVVLDYYIPCLKA